MSEYFNKLFLSFFLPYFYPYKPNVDIFWNSLFYSVYHNSRISNIFMSLFTLFLPTTECWRFIFQYSARFRPVCNRCVCVCVPFVVKAAGVFWPGSSKPEDKVGELLLRDSCLPHQKGRFFVHKNWKFRWKIVNF